MKLDSVFFFQAGPILEIFLRVLVCGLILGCQPCIFKQNYKELTAYFYRSKRLLVLATVLERTAPRNVVFFCDLCIFFAGLAFITTSGLRLYIDLQEMHQWQFNLAVNVLPSARNASLLQCRICYPLEKVLSQGSNYNRGPFFKKFLIF